MDSNIGISDRIAAFKEKIHLRKGLNKNMEFISIGK